ncbi:hypothetical protein EGW08_014325 [Elysia chlorotica]|uniref:Uncharacterized protein n=1 Tax=Elysia chlorotica TaxID=188477 RepID=A0A3S0ZLT0_ELYCH|nr:hypothetical protein EGW08_014325 [Elysia chlorotica]
MNREPSNLTPEPGFVVIKYGDDQEAILNPLCSTYIFLEWIKRICQCDNDRQGDHGPNRYISLLNNLEQVNPELLVKLNNLSRPNTRSSNKKDKLRRAAIRTPRTANNGTKTDNRQRPTSSSRSRQGK